MAASHGVYAFGHWQADSHEWDQLQNLHACIEYGTDFTWTCNSIQPQKPTWNQDSAREICGPQ